jgi:hypothetical protein
MEASESEEAHPCPLCLEDMGVPDYVPANEPLPPGAVARGAHRRPCGHVLHAACAMAAVDAGSAACLVCRTTPTAPTNDPTGAIAAFKAAYRDARAPGAGAAERSAAIRAVTMTPLSWLRMNPVVVSEMAAMAMTTCDTWDGRGEYGPAHVTLSWFRREAWLKRDMPALQRVVRQRASAASKFLAAHFSSVGYPKELLGRALYLASSYDEWIPRRPHVHTGTEHALWWVPRGAQFKLVVGEEVAAQGRRLVAVPGSEWVLHPDFPTAPSPCGAFVNNVA